MYNDTVIKLRHHPDANPWFDHTFTSPTYQKVLQKYIRNYING